MSQLQQQIADEVKVQLAESASAGQYSVVDLNAILGGLGTVDDLVAKVYPTLSHFLPPNIALGAGIIVKLIHAIRETLPQPSPAFGPGGETPAK